MKRPLALISLASLLSLSAMASPPADAGLFGMNGVSTVIFNVKGGFPALNVVTTTQVGWAGETLLGHPRFENCSFVVVPDRSNQVLQHVAACFNATKPQPIDFSLTRPIAADAGVLQDCKGMVFRSVTFPMCETGAVNPGYVNVSFGGGTPGQGQVVKFNQAQAGRTQKKWLPSNFRLAIDGMDCSHASKIEPITVKQSIADLDRDGIPDVCLTPSAIQIVVPSDEALPVLQYLQQGVGSNLWPADGDLDFLDASSSTGASLLSLKLHGLQPVAASPSFNPLTGTLQWTLTIRVQRIDMA